MQIRLFGPTHVTLLVIASALMGFVASLLGGCGPEKPTVVNPSPYCSWTNAGDRTCAYPPQLEPQK